MSTGTTESRTVNFDGKPVKLTNGSRPTTDVDPTVWSKIDAQASATEVAPVRDDAIAIAMRDRRAQTASLPTRWKRFKTTLAAVLDAMAVTNPPFSAVHGGYTQAQIDQYRTRAEMHSPRW